MKAIQDLCKGKSIAIVGNAESLHSMGKAQEIDAHDIVIRMNKGVMAEPEILDRHLGNKCTIYTFSGKGYVDEKEHHTQKPEFSVWMTTRNREEAPDHVKFFPFPMWENLQRDLAQFGDPNAAKEIRPSTGIMVIYMILKGVEYGQVDIYGFDFWQTKTFYNKKTISAKRSIQPSAEKLLVERLLAEHRNVTFIRKPDTMPVQPKGWLSQGVHRLPRFLLSSYARLFSRKFEQDYGFDAAIFKDKHVLLVGPARTINEDLKALTPLHYDCIVKMNNGLSTPIETLDADAWRCDVLFHNLAEDSRPVEVEHLQRAGVKLIVHRTASRRFYPVTVQAFEFFNGLNPPVDVKLIPSWKYKRLRKQLQGHMPSTGLMCIRLLLDVPVASLSIAGFTFFNTRYVEGYKDEVVNDADSVDRIQKLGYHDPDREAALLKAWLLEANKQGKLVQLGTNVKTAMEKISREGRGVQ